MSRVINSANTTRIPSQRPRGTAMVCTHRERFDFCAGLSTGAFLADKYSLNPGDSDTFPWLCEVANRYEKYKVKKLKFHYIPQCSTATEGTVSLVFDFGPEDPAPSDMSKALTYHDYSSGPAWSTQTLTPSIRDGDRLPQRNTRQHGEAVGDINIFDVGNLFVCTEGFTVATIIGYVEVEYEIEFFIHQLPTSFGGQMTTGAFVAYGTVTDYPVFTGTPLVTDLIQNGEAVPLASVVGTPGKFTFSSDFEGVIQFILRHYGTDVATNLTILTDIATKRTAMKAVAPAGGDSCYSVPVKAKKGEYITPVVSTAAGAYFMPLLNVLKAPYTYLEL